MFRLPLVLMQTAPGSSSGGGGGGAPAGGGGTGGGGAAGGGAAGGGAPAGGGGGQPAGAGGSGGAPAAPWYGEIADAELKTWAATKNFSDPATALAAFRNTERFVGAPADSLIRKPKDANDAAGIAAYRAALGVPEAADKYEIPVPEGQAPTLAEWAKPVFHKLGVPADIAKGLATEWNGFLETQTKAAEQADKEALAAADVTLRKDWGNQYDANRELARRAYTTFAEKAGLGDAVQHLEAAMGIPSVVKFLHAIATSSGEATFKDGGPGGGGSAVLTPQAAQQRIQQLRADKDWVAGYTKGDLNKQLEFAQLNAVVTGDDSAVKVLQAKIARGS